MGWFDAVATRYGCRVQGATACAMTNIDVLGYLDEIKICVAYDIDGEQTRDFPSSPKLSHAKPVYVTLPGWKTDIRGVTDYDALPENCKNYLSYIERVIETPLTIISTGPRREEIIFR